MPRAPTPNAVPAALSFSLTPIGVARSPFREKVEAPRQGVMAAEVEGAIELFPGRGYEDAVCDLAGWSRIWVVFWFDRVVGWRPKVQPPRSDTKRGVFATRSPHRPNPIGLSCVQLLGVEGLSLRVRGLDLLDGTPILDLKPYVPYADAFPEARAGWLDEDEPARAPSDGPAEARDATAYTVVWGALAAAQRDWLSARGEDIAAPVETVLAAGPRPHAYRRIRAEGAGFRLAYKAYRVAFHLDGRAIHVDRVDTGYRPKQLAEDAGLALHRELCAAFPRDPGG